MLDKRKLELYFTCTMPQNWIMGKQERQKVIDTRTLNL